MKYRQNVQLYQEVQKDTATKILDLDLPDPISALELEVECTNGATSNKGNFISDIVTKIEVVDGSEVLYSVSMAQLEALQFYKTGRMPVMFPSEWGGGLQRHNALVLFGRYLNDPEYVFQPARYRNPQLKVTFNKAAIRAAGVAGFADADNIKLSVCDHIIQEGATPRGFLSARQVMSYTTLSSGDKRIDLLTDFPTRLMLVRAWLQVSDIDELFTDLKLTFDSDKYILLNRKVKQLDAQALAQFGFGRVKHDIFTQHQAAFRLLFNKEPSFYGWSWEDATPEILGVRYTWSSEGKLDISDNAGTAITSDMKITGVEEGHALHATLPIVMGELMKPETWMDMSSYKKAELVLSQAVGGAVGEIVQEQVRGA